ncbi:DNA/RNA helicase domain-containing protein [Vagococcus fluvialis]|uniref:DNA/RNA helicase domain-containing protein n=1 Tax=Vagococcus fluvialis TaxID=2738 RepID=UPI0037A3FDD8
MNRKFNNNYGITYTLSEFFRIDSTSLVNEVKSFAESNGFPVSDSQVDSWLDCFEFLNNMFGKSNADPELVLIFEYLLPLEGGRRPDVILLMSKKVIVLEFKRKGRILLEDQKQAILYKQDLSNYHEATTDQQLKVESYLVFTLDAEEKGNEIIPILSRENFLEFINNEIVGMDPMEDYFVNEWLSSNYTPLPSIISASKLLFETGELPQIKRIKDGDISEALSVIEEVVTSTKLDKTIIFVNGVPGSGKTLVGLKSVYDNISKNINPIFLSGNVPLVNVLQGLLSENNNQGRALVRDMHAFKREYQRLDKISDNQFIVFDEAQRAWDEKKTGTKSEPEILLSIGDEIANKHKKVTILCLVGDGQAIHTGEEQGMRLWFDAINKHNDWNVVSSFKFKDTNFKHYLKSKLYLSTSIRHNFINVSPFVESILSANLEKAKKTYRDINRQGYFIYVVRDFNKLPQFVMKLKMNRPSDHTGFFVSSKVSSSKLLEITDGHVKSSFVKANEAFNWYMKDSDKLETAASEFLCQGLESEWPIVCFGGDYYIEAGSWKIEKSVSNTQSKIFADFNKIMANIYRILLTRSREGMVVYIPNLPELDELHSFFKEVIS